MVPPSHFLTKQIWKRLWRNGQSVLSWGHLSLPSQGGDTRLSTSSSSQLSRPSDSQGGTTDSQAERAAWLLSFDCWGMLIWRMVNINQWFKMFPIPTVRILIMMDDMDDNTASTPCRINSMALASLSKFRGCQRSTQHFGESSCSSQTEKDTTRPNWENLPGKWSTRSSSATGHKLVPAGMEPGICHVVTRLCGISSICSMSLWYVFWDCSRPYIVLIPPTYRLDVDVKCTRWNVAIATKSYTKCSVSTTVSEQKLLFASHSVPVIPACCRVPRKQTCEERDTGKGKGKGKKGRRKGGKKGSKKGGGKGGRKGVRKGEDIVNWWQVVPIATCTALWLFVSVVLIFLSIFRLVMLSIPLGAGKYKQKEGEA